MPVCNLFVFNARRAGRNTGTEEDPYFFTGSTVTVYLTGPSVKINLRLDVTIESRVHRHPRPSSTPPDGLFSPFAPRSFSAHTSFISLYPYIPLQVCPTPSWVLDPYLMLAESTGTKIRITIFSHNCQLNPPRSANSGHVFSLASCTWGRVGHDELGMSWKAIEPEFGGSVPIPTTTLRSSNSYVR